jgi:hypothetical protein
MCRAFFRYHLVLGLALGLSAWGVAASADDFMVYSARYEGVAPLSNNALTALAREQGSAEWMRFDANGALSRAVLRLGAPGVGNPGFTSMTRVEFETNQGSAATQVGKDGRAVFRMDKQYYAMEWRLPKAVGEEPFETVVYLKDRVLYTEQRVEEVSANGVRPVFIRVDYGAGSSIVQVFDRADGAPAPAPLTASGQTSAKAAQVDPRGDPGKAAQRQLVQFTAPPNGLDLGFDSGWWPNGKEGGFEPEPGGFPVQVRLKAVAVASYQSDIQGFFSLDHDWLTAGSASGSWGYDFGAELLVKGAFDLGFIDPFVVDIPYVPDINLRTTASDTFDSFLFDTTSTLHDQTPRSKLFDVDLVDIILGLVGVSLPDWISWIPFTAGAGVDVSIIADGTLECDTISLTDGMLFWTEGQSIPVEVPLAGYKETATYNELCNLVMTLDFFPVIFIDIFGARYDLPILDIPWKPFNGPLDLVYTQPQLNFTGEPPVGDVTDWFTERFVVDNDLRFRKTTFLPVSAPNGYVACSGPATEYSTSPLGSALLSLGDDAFAEVNLSGGKQVILFGESYDRIYIGSNGYLTFTQGDTEKAETNESHFNLPRVSGMFDNLKPNDGGEISWKQLGDRVVVTYDQVRVDGNFTGDTASFQIEMFFDGTIAITWLELEMFDGMAGLSRGGGVPDGFKESDLGSYAPCIVTEGEGEGLAEGEGALEGEGAMTDCPVPCAVSYCGLTGLNTGLTAAVTQVYAFLGQDSSTADLDQNGLADLAQLQMLDVILGSPGVQNRCCVLMAWQNNYALFAPLVDALDPSVLAQIPAAPLKAVLTGMATQGEPATLSVLQSLLTLVGLSVASSQLDRSAEQYLAGYGDADTDGVCNLAEYNATVSGPSSYLTFVIAAIDPSSRQNGGGCGEPCYSETTEGEGEGQGAAFSVTASSAGNAGTVSITLSPEYSPGLTAGQYYIGTSVTARALFNAATDQWLGWQVNGAPGSMNNPMTFSVTGNTALVAQFAPILVEGEGTAEGEGAAEGEGVAEGEGEGELAELLVLPFVLGIGPIPAGQCSTGTFTVTNSAVAGAPVEGTATAAAPFEVISGSPYTLGPGESADVVIQFCPAAAGSFSSPVTFTGGSGAVHPVLGEATEAPVEGEGLAEGEGAAEGEGVSEGEGVVEGEGEGETGPHSADFNPQDWQINLTELLRVIQFFNIRGYQCAPAPDATEDGYLAGSGENHACPPHSSDYNPQDWVIDLTELLRLIQFFNIGGYHLDPTGEDGYAAGPIPKA